MNRFYLFGGFAVCLALIIGVFSYSNNKFKRLEKKIDNWSEQTRLTRYRSDLLSVRRLILSMDSKILAAEKSGNVLQLVHGLRQFVYKGVPQQNDPTGNRDTFSLYWYFRDSVCDPKFGQLCLGLSHSYNIALESFSIPARRVDMFNNDGGTHASIEVFVNGRWILSDPTYDVFFRDAENEFIDWQNVRNKMLSGEKMGKDIIADGSDLRGAYKLVALFNKIWNMVVYPARVSRLGGETRYPLITLPKSWDRTIRLPDGGIESALYLDQSRPDRILALGLLR